VVGCQYEREGIAITVRRKKGGNRDRKTRIAAHGNVCLDAAFAQLLGHDKGEVGIGDDDRSREQVGMRNARKPLLERRPLPDERNELFGHALA
jgi:hypothetical protein